MMRYHALACDYDGTLASQGQVDDKTVDALERLRASGRKLILVTGRQLEELLKTFPKAGVFDRIVAENGAILYHPASREEKVLAEPPPAELVAALRAGGVEPAVGRSIVATWEPHQETAARVIHDLGLEYHVFFNKGAVMLLPSGVNKATGLQAALEELGLSPHNVAGIGDAENDHAFLTLCECSAAVVNALPSVKKRADFVSQSAHGAGVAEFIEALISDDLRALEPRLGRHDISIGTREDGREVRLPSHGWSVLLMGDSGSGKSTFATAFLERLTQTGHQFCVIDPEGDYDDLDGVTTLGDDHAPPGVESMMKLLRKPSGAAAVNLLAIPLKDRPRFFETFFPRLQELRMSTGRPHWIVIDEAQHMMPPSWDLRPAAAPEIFQGLLIITIQPEHLPPAVLKLMDVVVAVGPWAGEAPALLNRALGEPAPAPPEGAGRPQDALVWFRRNGERPSWFRPGVPRGAHQRHVRKYMNGVMDPKKSFYFRGPEGGSNLRAYNLETFLQLLDGVDERTWLYHLGRGDYARWFLDCIKDGDLAAEAARAESDPARSRESVRDAVQRRYSV
jgi:HAD superfamily hydrolase (TIGR01484 family)